MKEYDHALDALRYLICKLDARKMARMRKRGRAEEELPDQRQKPSIFESILGAAERPEGRGRSSGSNPTIWHGLLELSDSLGRYLSAP
jgi:hypothetical protein